MRVEREKYEELAAELTGKAEKEAAGRAELESRIEQLTAVEVAKADRLEQLEKEYETVSSQALHYWQNRVLTHLPGAEAMKVGA